MKPHEEWLIKAEHDLKSSRRLIEGDDPITDTAIYHTQQCAEKALKGFLVYHNLEIDKTHHLKILLNRCSALNPSFNTLVESANSLSPYATLFRYPGDLLVPAVEDVESAIEAAESILVFVKKQITSSRRSD